MPNWQLLIFKPHFKEVGVKYFTQFVCPTNMKSGQDCCQLDSYLEQLSFRLISPFVCPTSIKSGRNCCQRRVIEVAVLFSDRRTKMFSFYVQSNSFKMPELGQLLEMNTISIEFLIVVRLGQNIWLDKHTVQCK